MKYKLIISVVLLGFTSLSFAQKEVRKQMRAGNKEYRQEKYTEAEIAYRKALQANARSAEAAYNLGNALYKQGKLPEAGEQYQIVTSQEKDQDILSKAWHNTGNIFLGTAISKKEDPSYNETLKKSIEAFKQSLRNNPNNSETRYNLALAQKLLKDNEDKGGGGGGDKDQKQDQNKDQQQQQDQQKQDQNKDQQQQQQMSKENAQQILDAMMQDEKNTQDKVKEQQMKVQQRKKTDKEW